jgi:hypothetical protein
MLAFQSTGGLSGTTTLQANKSKIIFATRTMFFDAVAEAIATAHLGTLAIPVALLTRNIARSKFTVTIN